jgi:hypothetical protein
LIFCHFSCIFNPFAQFVSTPDYAPIAPNIPCFDDSLHT